MNSKDFILDDFLPYQISALSSRLNNLLSKTYSKKYGLSIPEWRVLVHVARRDKMSVRDIHKCVNLEKPAVSRAVAKLETAGLLAKTTSELDHRLVDIQLTKAGFKVLDNITPKALSFEEDLLSAFSHKEKIQLNALMERLHDELDKHPDAAERKLRADGRPRKIQK